MLPRSLLATALLAGPAIGQMPPVPVPPQNPLTPAKIVLGKILFWDEQLSADDSMACGTCHLPEFGGSDPRTPVAVNPGPDGIYGTDDDILGSPGVSRQLANGDFAPAHGFGLRPQVTGRTANTTLGAGHHNDLFWDLRATSEFTDPETNQVLIPFGGALESQALAPILSFVEMAGEGRTWQDVRQKLQSVRPLALATNLTPDIQAALQQNPTYPSLFAAAFGDPAITAARIAFAIASYERILEPDDTPWDRFMLGQTNALTHAEQMGLNLFNGVGRCNACHPGPLFHNDQAQNLGLRPALEDRGLGGVTLVSADDGAFKTPTLRNAGLRPRLFHNGQSPALSDPSQRTHPKSVHTVYMDGGGVDRSNLDPFLLPLAQLGVTNMQMTQMLRFVDSALTDPRCAQALPPFDHPTLRSMQGVGPLVFGQGLAGSSEPMLADSVPSFLGNQEWKLGLAAGDGPTLSYLGYGLRGMPAGISFGGLPWNVDVLDGRLFALTGASGQIGHTTWRLPIPADNNLLSVELYFQLWAIDPQSPVGISTSRGWRFLMR
jgi:cytochrome c peroxidase